MPFSVNFASTDKAAHDLVLSLREELETFVEFCGLTGWNRVAVVGGRRDELRKQGTACAAADVLASFAGVKWGPGRELSVAVVEKMLALWNRMSTVQELVDIVLEAQSLWGRGSPFEEYSKLKRDDAGR